MSFQSETFAFVDIETTGLFHSQHAITEIAIWRVTGEHVVKRWHSLVNPERNIPDPIRRLTGINKITVAEAPPFSEIAARVFDLLDGAIMVAHNAPFDYSFLKAALASSGFVYNPKRLCTMRLARHVIPSLRSASLPALCDYFNLSSSGFHRAETDVEATFALFGKLRELAGSPEFIDGQLRRRNQMLPPAIAPERFTDLPNSPGVYYFYGANGKPIYIGKAKNLKQRIASHFSTGDSERKKQHLLKHATRFEFNTTVNEYEALLLEDAEIRRTWPEVNAAQKTRALTWTIHPYTSRDGEIRLAITSRNSSDTLGSFHSRHAASEWLFRRLIDAGIDTAIMGVKWPEDFDLSESALSTETIGNFLMDIRTEFAQSAILALPISDDTFQAVLIGKGQYLGFGILTASELELSQHRWISFRKAPDTPAAWTVVRRMMGENSLRVLPYARSRDFFKQPDRLILSTIFSTSIEDITE